MMHMACARLKESCSHCSLKVAALVGDASTQPARPNIDHTVDFVTRDHAVGRDNQAAKLSVIAAFPPLTQELLDLGLPQCPNACLQWVEELADVEGHLQYAQTSTRMCF